MAHALDPLLRPRSIAVIGASRDEHKVGGRALKNLLDGGYRGRLYAVNPRYEEVQGLPCHASLETLPEPIEHALFAVGDHRIEALLEQAIACGVRAATLISPLMPAEDRDPPLRERIRARLRESGMLVCGGNGMGFYNFRDSVWACGFDTRSHRPPGNVTLISHSGSGMCGIVDVDERIDFNLAVSTGQELTVTMDQYLDFALDLPETRAVGLFMETARNPAGLIAAFQKARARRIPIVAIKVGRSALAAELTVSHCGAMAGVDASYEALFERYGVQRVADMDELATALIMFAQPHPVGPGGLVSIHDSGGERQLTIDLATELGVPLAELDEASVERLAQCLDPGLAAVNPLDAWSVGGPDSAQLMRECLGILLSDPAAALGAVIHDRAPFGRIYPGYLEYLRTAHAATGKPVFLVANRQGTGADPAVAAATAEGFPVIDGLRSFLTGVRCLFGFRDAFEHSWPTPEPAPGPIVEKWEARLRTPGPLDVMTATELLADFGLPMNPLRRVESADEAVAAAQALGLPVVLKTARTDIAHKSEHGAVLLDLQERAAVAAGYHALAARLGPEVLVTPMVTDPGVEMILGLVHDEQFGPVVMMGAGGVHAELLADRVFALPPFEAAAARRCIERLRLRPLLDGQRGAPAVAVDAYCAAAERLSALAAALAGAVAEIDLNPLIVTAQGCVAVDALVIARGLQTGSIEQRRPA